MNEWSTEIAPEPPAVPPPAPNPPPTDFALQDFDKAIDALKRLMTKPSAQFAQTVHSADDLKHVEDFIHAVMGARTPRASKEPN